MKGTSNRSRRVLLVGPAYGVKTAAYNAGKGGYVRTMQVYLKHFKPAGFELVPCFTSVRQPKEIPGVTVTLRFCSDLARFIDHVTKADLVHVLATYRRAFPREAAMAYITHLLRKPLIYDIRAGAFINWYNRCTTPVRRVCRFVIRSAAAVLCEGRSVKSFVETTFQRPAVYVPSFVPTEEIPDEVPELFTSERLRIAYVGFCYRGKGVFELLDAVVECRRKGLPLQLTLAGQEEPEFSNYANRLMRERPDLPVRRLGPLETHSEALDCIRQCDVFCLVSDHPGEGHTNVINEAMMYGRVVIVTQHGFLADVLDESCAYFLPEKSVRALVAAIEQIYADQALARQKASAARQRLLDRFTSKQAFGVVEQCYRGAVGSSRFEV